MRSCFLIATDINYPSEALYTFSENKLSQLHNSVMLDMNENTLYTLPVIDEFTNNVDNSVINRALNQNQSETGGLAGLLDIKVNARVMLTVNVDRVDRLINSQP